MHKKSIELMKKCMDEICMITEPTAEQWQNFYHCMKGCAAGVCAEKDFKSIEAMEEAKKEADALKLLGAVPPTAKVGYNNRRYANGEYAPTGRGHVSGFYPYYAMEDDDFIHGYVNDPNFANNMRMGYKQNNTGAMNTQSYNNTGTMPGYWNDSMDMPKVGRSYKGYMDARKHYTETNDQVHKTKMKEKADEVFNELEEMAMDIIKDMTPDEKYKYKERLQRTANKI